MCRPSSKPALPRCDPTTLPHPFMLRFNRRWTSSHELSFSVSSAAELVALLELLSALQNRRLDIHAFS